jgi:glycogen synthase
MKVLMFGWEFPPHISGGLGTACYGLTKGLAKHGAEILFVVPKAFGDEDQQAVRIVNAEDTEIFVNEEFVSEVWDKIQYMEAHSNLIPYITPEEYEEAIQLENKHRHTYLQEKFRGRFSFSGTYGASLFEEVNMYGLLGGAIARRYDFDVIHAHDWQ